MPEPRELLIVQSVQTALLAIAVAGGYYSTVAAGAVKLDPNASVESLMRPDGPRPFVLLELKPDTWEYSPANQVKLTLPMVVHWVSDSTPTDDTSRLQVYLRGCADVEKALAVDITRGGLAYDTRVVSREMDLAMDGAQVWAQIGIEIRVNREFGAPAT